MNSPFRFHVDRATILSSGIDPFLSTALSAGRLLSRQFLVIRFSWAVGVSHSRRVDRSKVVHNGLSN